MKINHKILSIPPHISTAWQNIASLCVDEKGALVITLVSGSIITVPGLDTPTLKQIFTMHEEVIEGAGKREKPALDFSFGLPFKMDGGMKLEEMGGMANMMMQHDPAQAESPDLPKEILEKIGAISKAIGVDELSDQMPPAEPHCNCPYCQLSRAMNNEERKESSEEEVSDEELTFRDWSVEQIGEKLFRVTSPFDENEQYQVFLGSPVGCTCGEKDCEHIRIALSS